MVADAVTGSNVLNAAQAWWDAGASVIPVRADGTKKPVLAWKQFTEDRIDRDVLESSWFGGDSTAGLAVICGAVSGGIEMLELEGRAATSENLDKIYAELLRHGYNKIWDRLLTEGYSEWTPSGGLHLIYRTDGSWEVPGNTKIANNAARECLAETRGEGGYVIVAPSGGTVHSTGEPWTKLTGSPGDLIALTVYQRVFIHDAIRAALDETPPEPERLRIPSQGVVIGHGTMQTDGERPGDEFNRRADWASILLPEGWTHSHRHGNEDFWTRPGKERRDGISASTGYRDGADCLYVWSSSTGLPTETPLSKLYVFAFYHHGGDMSAAASALRKQGFGADRPASGIDPWLGATSFRPPHADELLNGSWDTPIADDGTWSVMTQPQAPAQDESKPRRLRVTRASEFKIKRVRWLWESRVPIGEITLVPGREGVGKSLVLASIAAAITRGTLPGEHHGTPRAVAYCASEDSWSHTIAPRMIAAGADMGLILRVDLDPDSGESGAPLLPTDCAELAQLMLDEKVACLMLDPIVSMIHGSLDTFKAPELRRALEPLRRAAEKANVAVLALAHFNKTAGVDVGSKVAGSRAWLEVARAAFSVAEMEAENDGEDDFLSGSKPRECVLSQIKNNLGKLGLPNLTYTIEEIFIETDEDDGERASVGRLRWTGQTTMSVSDVLGKDHRNDLGASSAEILAYVRGEYERSGLGCDLKEIYEALGDDVKAPNVRVILSRLVARGKITKTGRGLYRYVDQRLAGAPVGVPGTPPQGEDHVGVDGDGVPSEGSAGSGTGPGASAAGLRAGGRGVVAPDRGARPGVDLFGPEFDSGVAVGVGGTNGHHPPPGS